MHNMIFKKIRKEMIDQEITITELAHRTGYTREHLSRVLHGHQESIKAKKSVAFAMGRTFENLWDTENSSNEIYDGSKSAK